MNQNRQFNYPLFTFVLLLISISGIHSFATNNTRQIIITGKVTNADIGSPVVNHEVFITSKSVTMKNASYSKTVLTDEEGFYYDTLTTSLNKGSVEVYTFDRNNKIIEKKLYFRFIELRSSNIFVADFSIYMPYQTEQLQANFKYEQQDEKNHFLYQFTDLTINENISSWHWVFGDGDESGEKNPEHTFEAPGLYKITLTVTADINGLNQTSSFSTYIYVTDESYFHLGGHCFAGYFPIDMGQAYLYFIDEKQKFIPIDTSSFDTLGYYYFYEIPEGEYCIKVQPQSASEFYGSMVPTYFGNEVFWEMATHISHHQTNWEYDIHLVEGNEVEPGVCRISGNVAYGDTLTNNRATPAEGIDFFLIKEDGALLSSHYSDGDGNFSFDKIENGKYWLSADIPGYNCLDKLVELTDSSPEISNIEIIIANGDINMSVDNEAIVSSNSLGKVFPNPASDYFNIEFSATANGTLTIEILDTQGKLLQTENRVLQNGETTVTVNISSLKSGHYIVLLKNAGKTTGIPLIVSK